MATANAFRDFCAELFAPLGPVRTRAMFGGHGFYVDGLFMALIADGQLYLKADDVTRERFVAAGCTPFTYGTKDGERQVMSYYRPPEEALESPPLMQPWARLAFEAALRAANAKKPATKKVAKKTTKKAPSAPAAKPPAKQAPAKKASAAKKATAKRRAAGGG